MQAYPQQLLQANYATSCSIKRPDLNFSQKVSIKRLGLSQVLRASIHENEESLDFFEKNFNKRSGQYYLNFKF